MKLFVRKLLLHFLGGGAGCGDEPWGPGTLVDMAGSPQGSLKIFLEHSLASVSQSLRKVTFLPNPVWEIYS